jgi:hypothetical protein
MGVPGVSHALNRRLGAALQIEAARRNKQNLWRQPLKGRHGAKLAPGSPPRALTREQKTRHRLRPTLPTSAFTTVNGSFILSPTRNRQTR